MPCLSSRLRPRKRPHGVAAERAAKTTISGRARQAANEARPYWKLTNDAACWPHGRPGTARIFSSVARLARILNAACRTAPDTCGGPTIRRLRLSFRRAAWLRERRNRQTG